MQKSKIEWLDGGYTFNPVTGCLHGCEYCYARKIAHRFGQEENEKGKIHSIQKRWPNNFDDYPFDPTFYYYRLDEPQGKKKPQNVFVCSMADLFGSWIPDEWLQLVFEACDKAPWHRFLFLTKNSRRYVELFKAGRLPTNKNFWYGSTITSPNQQYFTSRLHNTFLSIEPILESFAEIKNERTQAHWLILGAETGNRKGKVVPHKDWIYGLVETAKHRQGIPVFLKNNLAEIWGKPLIQQFPWEKG